MLARARLARAQVTEEETKDTLGDGYPTIDPTTAPKGVVNCWDPSTMKSLGTLPAMGREEVVARIERSRRAQATWAKSSFAQRRLLLKTILKYIIDHQDTIARVSARDSGKSKVDAAMGEIMVTCEKLRWTINRGEQYLLPESRESGTLMPHKRVWLEYVPVGVVGAIVPWNYPFHNVFNPLIAALFSGNGFVVKVSEYSSWSTRYYGRIIEECLKAVGAPVDLVQIVTGFGETGHALVTGGINKLIFVGSPEIGAKVMESAATTFHPTPVILELGGKDPFIVCEDYKVTDDLVQVAVRGVYIHMGQNCAGPERFFVYESIYDDFVSRCERLIKQLELGDPLSSCTVDCGAVVMGDRTKVRARRCGPRRRAVAPRRRGACAAGLTTARPPDAPPRACARARALRRRRCRSWSTTRCRRARAASLVGTSRPRTPRSAAARSTRRRCWWTCRSTR